jgi:hypothetical protein
MTNLMILKQTHVFKFNSGQNNMATISHLSPHLPSSNDMGTVITDWATQCFLWVNTLPTIGTMDLLNKRSCCRVFTTAPS